MEKHSQLHQALLAGLKEGSSQSPPLHGWTGLSGCPQLSVSLCLVCSLPVAVSSPLKDLQMKSSAHGSGAVEHTCKGRTCSRDRLSALVSSHRPHYKESPGDRMVSSSEHPRGAPIRNIPLLQRQGEAQAPRVIPSDVPRWEPQGWKGAEIWQRDQGQAGMGLPYTHERFGEVTLSPGGHLGHSPLSWFGKTGDC